jgi:hypothetical protein
MDQFQAWERFDFLAVGSCSLVGAIELVVKASMTLNYCLERR